MTWLKVYKFDGQNSAFHTEAHNRQPYTFEQSVPES